MKSTVYGVAPDRGGLALVPGGSAVGAAFAGKHEGRQQIVITVVTMIFALAGRQAGLGGWHRSSSRLYDHVWRQYGQREH